MEYFSVKVESRVTLNCLRASPFGSWQRADFRSEESWLHMALSLCSCEVSESSSRSFPPELEWMDLCCHQILIAWCQSKFYYTWLHTCILIVAIRMTPIMWPKDSWEGKISTGQVPRLCCFGKPPTATILESILGPCLQSPPPCHHRCGSHLLRSLIWSSRTPRSRQSARNIVSSLIPVGFFHHR